jgi:hypothetical protein
LATFTRSAATWAPSTRWPAVAAPILRAYTKAAIGWLDASAIKRYALGSGQYDLYSVGLTQPPPSGRVTAIRVGSQVPYLMIEARQRVDQFDRNIPSEGVIVYRVQTSDRLGHTQNNLPPIELLTTTALQPGQSFSLDDGLNVHVVGALPGGFSVRVNDPNQYLVDRTEEFGTPPAESPPTACVIPGLGVHNIAYRDKDGQLHELWRDAQGATGTTDLTANAGAPPAMGNPFAYVDTSRNTEILLYRSSDGTVRSLYWSTGAVGHDNLGGTAGAPPAAADPVGYYAAAADTHHVIYRTSNRHLHELRWFGLAPVLYGGDLTALASAPVADGQPSAFVNGSGDNIVIYRGGSNHIRSLYWTTGAVAEEDLSGYAGTPKATGDPVAYYTAQDDTHQLVYLGEDGHLWELYWQGLAPVVGWDLTPSGAPAAPAGALAAFYSAGTNTKHVIYRSSNNRLHEIWWTPGGGTPVHVDITSFYGAPPAADRPAAFAVEGPSMQHVAYRGTNQHIYEVVW